MDPLGKVERLVVHHTERNNDFRAFVRMRHVYLNSWEDIGYHYLIGNKRPFSRDGKLYRARPEELEGAHARGYNHNSLSVCLIGNLDINLPTEKQFETLFSFLDEKILQYVLSSDNVRGHNELPGTDKSCPGRFLDMGYVRSVVSGREEFSYSLYKQMVRESMVQPSGGLLQHR